MLDLLINAVLQASALGIGCIGASLTFRVLRYPDLTPDGSFMIGSAVFAASVGSGMHWLLAVLCAVLGGVAAGILTGLISEWIKVTRLLAGILSTMICYSTAFRLLGGGPNRGIASTLLHGWNDTALGTFLIALAPIFLVSLLVQQLLRSELGLLLRATGSNSALVAGFGRSPRLYTMIGLGIGNGLVALAAVVVSLQQQFVDLNFGVGIVITFLCAVLLGEGIYGILPASLRSKAGLRSLAPVVGCAVYFSMYLLVLRASLRDWLPFSIEPADLKLLSAVLLIALAASRQGKGLRDIPI